MSINFNIVTVPLFIDYLFTPKNIISCLSKTAYNELE